uniref:Uncharacterized protein n=1 Tax=Anolis carolinensis TaxID=28377 RepID=A0A803TRD6_ANOCA
MIIMKRTEVILLKFWKTPRLTSNFISSFCISFHSPQPSQKNVSPQNRLQELCSKECVLIFLCTHSQFFTCKQTSL